MRSYDFIRLDVCFDTKQIRHNRSIAQMAIVDILFAKTDLAKLVARAERGEEIVIARNGKPAARLVAVKQINDGSRRLGLAAGQYETCTQAEFDSNNETIAKAWLERGDID